MEPQGCGAGLGVCNQCQAAGSALQDLLVSASSGSPGTCPLGTAVSPVPVGAAGVVPGPSQPHSLLGNGITGKKTDTELCSGGFWGHCCSFGGALDTQAPP